MERRGSRRGQSRRTLVGGDEELAGTGAGVLERKVRQLASRPAGARVGVRPLEGVLLSREDFPRPEVPCKTNR